MSEQRKGGCLDRPGDAIGAADPESRVSRLFPRECDADRRLEDRDRVALVVARLEELAVLGRRHPVALDEALSEETLGRFVEEDDGSPASTRNTAVARRAAKFLAKMRIRLRCGSGSAIDETLEQTATPAAVHPPMREPRAKQPAIPVLRS